MTMALASTSTFPAFPGVSTRVLKAAVVGSGKISEEHLKYLTRDVGVKLVGVCDLSPALAKFSAGKFGSTGAFTDAAAMFREAQPDVVHILTPPHTHGFLVTD